MYTVTNRSTQSVISTQVHGTHRSTRCPQYTLTYSVSLKIPVAYRPSLHPTFLLISPPPIPPSPPPSPSSSSPTPGPTPARNGLSIQLPVGGGTRGSSRAQRSCSPSAAHPAPHYEKVPPAWTPAPLEGPSPGLPALLPASARHRPEGERKGGLSVSILRVSKNGS